ncbi:unnamed protein product [Allacma fusca]|uniref:TATA-box-binding protein n=1 Tax=Allacma fusca TaxID=39272 RepID=A0A8J2J0B1_9HEXA|nr:unnamed protein product [Allacma fusca]
MAKELPPDVRDSIGAFKKVPRDVWKENIQEGLVIPPAMPNVKKRLHDYGNPYEETLNVMDALRRQKACELLEVDCILGENRPAKILNVVASVKVADRMDLNKIAENSWNVEFNKKQFAGLVIQVNNPKATGVVYSTGRMIVTGARSEEDSKIAAEHCLDVIKNAGCQVSSGSSYRVQNICATTHLGYRVRIHEMGANRDIKDSGKIFNFSPEIFAGLVCNFENPKVTVVCFATGTLLFSGAHREEDIQMALFRFRALSFPYRY